MSEKTKVSYYVASPLARAVRVLAATEERTQSEIAEAALESYLAARQEDFDWRAAAAAAFDFWENPVDAAYDEV